MVGFICGAWDLLHPGHLFTLRFCAEHCDELIVGLHMNPSLERKYKNHPVQTLFERWYQLKSCKWVGQIIPYETEQDLENILRMSHIDIRFIGEDYLTREDEITGMNIVPIRYVPRNHSYSSSELRKRI